MHANGNGKAATTSEFTPPTGKRKLFGGKAKVAPASNGAESRNMSANYKEHTWDTSLLQTHFTSSNIDGHNPRESKGLSYTEAKILLEENGPNLLPKAKEISDLKLYISQFLNPLWLLLLFADVLSFANFFADQS